MGSGMSKFMKSLLKSLGQIQYAKVPQCLSSNQGFFIHVLGGNCVPSPTPSSPDKAISAILIKVLQTKERDDTLRQSSKR